MGAKVDSSHLIQDFKSKWRKTSRTKKVLFGCIIFLCILSGWFTFHLINILLPLRPSGEASEPPRIFLYLNITKKAVYINGTVSFTVVCIVESYKNYPIPEGDLYQIEKAFICVKDDIIDFNSTFGELKNTSEITVKEGDFYLRANERVSMKFQTSFNLQNLTHIYVGVLANGPTGIRRWDRCTSIITESSR